MNQPVYTEYSQSVEFQVNERQSTEVEPPQNSSVLKTGNAVTRQTTWKRNILF